MAVALVGAVGAALRSAAASLSPAFGQATTAGHTLVAVVCSNTDAAFTVTGANGWSVWPGAKIGQAGNHLEIWYKPNCGAGEAAPTFNCQGATGMVGQLSEWNGADLVNPIQASGVTTSGVVGSAAVAITGVVPIAGSVAITGFCLKLAAAAAVVWTTGLGYTQRGHTGASNVLQWVTDSKDGPAVGGAESETETASVAGTWSGAIVILSPTVPPLSKTVLRLADFRTTVAATTSLRGTRCAVADFRKTREDVR